MNIVLLGAPGCGKGTISQYIKEKYHFTHLSTGEIFRSKMNEKSQLSNQLNSYILLGQLVPDELTNNIIKEAILDVKKNTNKILLDGYPRNLVQAEFLSRIITIDLVIFIDIAEELIIERIVGRRSCSKCGKIYNIFLNKPINDNVCDFDNEILVQRKDDNEKIVKNRLKVFNKSKKELLDFYSKEAKRIETIVSTNDKNNKIEADIERILNSYDLH